MHVIILQKAKKMPNVYIYIQKPHTFQKARKFALELSLNKPSKLANTQCLILFTGPLPNGNDINSV